MNADIQGAYKRLNKVWHLFEHRGKSLTKLQVKAVLEHGMAKGYTDTGQLTDEEVDTVLFFNSTNQR